MIYDLIFSIANGVDEKMARRQLRKRLFLMIHEWEEKGMSGWRHRLRTEPCSYCGGDGGTLDHIVPSSRRGQTHWSNITAACCSCNMHRGIMSPMVFLVTRLHVG